MKKKTIKIPKEFFEPLKAELGFTLEMVLVAYKIGRIDLDEAVRIIKRYESLKHYIRISW
jgi:hypothetical protein